jgi:uncharacterized protein involved in exopolysaccharide biosynthesis
MRSWVLILVCCGIGAVVFGAVTWLRPDSYSSEASLVYQSAGQGIPGLGDSAGSSDPTRVLSTQAKVVVGDQVLGSARAATELDVDELRERVSVEVDPDSDVMRVTGLGATAAEAQQVANAVATAYIEQNREQGLAAINSQIDALQTAIDTLNSEFDEFSGNDAAAVARRTALIDQIAALARQQEQLRAATSIFEGQVSVITAANLPAGSSTIDPVRGAALGVAAGLAVGLVAAIALHVRGGSANLRSRVSSATSTG